MIKIYSKSLNFPQHKQDFATLPHAKSNSFSWSSKRRSTTTVLKLPLDLELQETCLALLPLSGLLTKAYSKSLPHDNYLNRRHTIPLAKVRFKCLVFFVIQTFHANLIREINLN